MEVVKLKRIISCIVITLMIVTFVGCSANKSDKEDLVAFNDYMNATYHRLNISSFDEDINACKESIQDKKVFLLGENHAVHNNYELWFELLKYLNQKEGVTRILIEGSQSVAYRLNQYLKNGDSEIVKLCFENMSGTYYGNKDEIDYWKKIYDFNQSLPESNKLEVVGIDVEFQKSNAYSALKDIIKNHDSYPDSIKNELEDVIALADKISETIDDGSMVENLLNSLKEKRKDYEEVFGKDSFVFLQIVKNIRNANEIMKIQGNNVEFNQARDKIMLENFKTYEEKVPDKKYFGKFGGLHVVKSEQEQYKSLAMLLNSEYKPFEDKVWSCNIFYYQCKSFEPQRKKEIVINSMNEDSLYMKHFLGKQEKLAIYLLPKENSPFDSKSIRGWNLPEMYDAVIFMKDSPQSNPL